MIINEELLNKVLHGECLECMKKIEDKSIDMILCDLPYGSTACTWDAIIPIEPLWKQYERIIKDNGAIVLTASNPFSSVLIMSNPKWFRHEWIWDKEVGTNFVHVKKQPLKTHESILVFGKNKVNYNPQMREGKSYSAKSKGNKGDSEYQLKNTISMNGLKNDNKGLRYPKSIITFNSQKGELNNRKRLHPTQKPVELFEYLIKTYTNEDETILDNCLGSGTTAVAAINTNRNFIGIEKEDTYCEIANKRIEEAQKIRK